MKHEKSYFDEQRSFKSLRELYNSNEYSTCGNFCCDLFFSHTYNTHSDTHTHRERKGVREQLLEI